MKAIKRMIQELRISITKSPHILSKNQYNLTWAFQEKKFSKQKPLEEDGLPIQGKQYRNNQDGTSKTTLVPHTDLTNEYEEPNHEENPCQNPRSLSPSYIFILQNWQNTSKQSWQAGNHRTCRWFHRQTPTSIVRL